MPRLMARVWPVPMVAHSVLREVAVLKGAVQQDMDTLLKKLTESMKEGAPGASLGVEYAMLISLLANHVLRAPMTPMLQLSLLNAKPVQMNAQPALLLQSAKPVALAFLFPGPHAFRTARSHAVPALKLM